jgi:hypothetical protein
MLQKYPGSHFVFGESEESHALPAFWSQMAFSVGSFGKHLVVTFQSQQPASSQALPLLCFAHSTWRLAHNSRVSSTKPQSQRAGQKHHLLSEWRRLVAQVTLSTTGLLHSCSVVQCPNTAGKGKGRPGRHRQHSPAVQSFSVHLLFPSPDATGTSTRENSMFQVCTRSSQQCFDGSTAVEKHRQKGLWTKRYGGWGGGGEGGQRAANEDPAASRALRFGSNK